MAKVLKNFKLFVLLYYFTHFPTNGEGDGIQLGLRAFKSSILTCAVKCGDADWCYAFVQDTVTRMCELFALDGIEKYWNDGSLGTGNFVTYIRGITIESFPVVFEIFNDDAHKRALANLIACIAPTLSGTTLVVSEACNNTHMSSNKTCSFNCMEGLNLVGSSTRTCQANGLWSSPLPSCEIYADCWDVYSRSTSTHGTASSGVYTIQPNGYPDPFDVYCDMDNDGGGWTVFQRREDNSIDFYRNWTDYKEGFGDPQREFWLGNDKLYYLTFQRSYVLRVDLEDFDGETRFAKYDGFAIGNESSYCKLIITRNYSGNAGNGLWYHEGQPFTTKDSDNDNLTGNCAIHHKGGWWYNHCYYSNLNGLYLSADTDLQSGIIWRPWHLYSLKRTEMKVRPVGVPQYE